MTMRHKTSQEIMQSIYHQWMSIPAELSFKESKAIQEINKNTDFDISIKDEPIRNIYKMFIFRFVDNSIVDSFCLTDDKEHIDSLKEDQFVDVNTSIRHSEVMNYRTNESALSGKIIVLFDPCKDDVELYKAVIKEAEKNHEISNFMNHVSTRNIPNFDVLLKGLYSYVNHDIINFQRKKRGANNNEKSEETTDRK